MKQFDYELQNVIHLHMIKILLNNGNIAEKYNIPALIQQYIYFF